MTARRWAAVGVAVACVAGVVALAVAVRRPAARPAAQDQPAATTTIARGTLVDVQTFPGQLAYGPERPAESRLAGTVTAVPPVGRTIARGDALFRIDDKPVVLMYGTLPAYRTLTAGHAAVTAPTPSASGGAPDPASGPASPAIPASRGADVQEFETNLKALGYTGFVVDDTYTASTAAAVRHWQSDLGLPPTGEVELGRVFYAPAAVRVARQKLAPGALATGPVLSYTGTRRLVTATLPEHSSELAKVSAKVSVALSDGKSAAGTVTSVGSTSDDQAPADQEPTLDVVVALDDQRAVGGLDDGPARVSFVAQRRENVLYVPVGALLALAEGGYGLQVVDGGTTRIVAVTTGLFADGKVEITGGDVQAGMTVGMAR